MRKSPIVFDVDGVLANFTLGFSEWGAEMFSGVVPMSHNEQPTWDAIANMTKKQMDEVWRRVDKSPDFWYNLVPLVSLDERERIQQLSLEGPLYFVTNRRGMNAKVQTEAWLRRWFYIENPTVILAKYKADFCKSAGVKAAIDDKADNCCAIAWISPDTEPFVLDAVYNRFDPMIFGSKRVRRVYSVTEYLVYCEGLK